MAKGFLTLFTAFSRDQVSSCGRRVATEAPQAALMDFWQWFQPLVKGPVGWHSGHLLLPHHLGRDLSQHPQGSASRQLGVVWLS